MNRFLHTNMKHLYRCLIALASIMFLPIMARGQMVEINTGVNQIQVNLLDRGYEPGNITHLKVSGIIDVRDLCYIRDYIFNLEELDLSGITKIEDYQGRYTPPGLTGGVGSDRDGDHYYPANELPPQAFSKWVNGRVTGWNNPLPKLKKVILPSCIISIGEYAFYVNKGIENILIGEDNLYFKTIDGVLYDKEGKTLLQYPLGRKGDFTLPASVTKIESMGMNDASFTNLTLQTANPPELTSSPFKATTVWIPKGSLAAYRAHGYWRNYTLREIGGVDPALTVTKGEVDHFAGGYALQDKGKQGWMTFVKSVADAGLYIRLQLKDKSWTSAITMEYADEYLGERGTCSFDENGVAWIPLMGRKAEKCLWLTSNKVGAMEYKIDIYDDQKLQSLYSEDSVFHFITKLVAESSGNVEGEVGNILSFSLNLSNVGVFRGQSCDLTIYADRLPVESTTICYLENGQSKQISMEANNGSKTNTRGKITLALEEKDYLFTICSTIETQGGLSFSLNNENDLSYYVTGPDGISVYIANTSDLNAFFISGQLKYKVTGDNTVSVLGPDVAEGSGQQGNDNDSWTVTDCVIPATVSYNGKDYAVKAIEDEAFSGALNMKSISLPEGLVKIGYEAFYRCYGLQSLHIPASVVSIDTEDSEAFFSKLDVETITVANGNPKFTAENNILYNKAKTQVLWSAYLPSDKEMVLPETVTDIRAYAFAYQDHLTSMTCPAGIKIIGSNAFADCESLTTLRFRGEIPPSLGDEAFSGVEASGLTVYVPKGSKPLYEKWNIFSDIVEEGGSEEPIGGEFTIGQLKYTVIGKDEVAISGVTDKTPAYYDIKQTVTYESIVYKVTTVGKEAFKGCTNLVRFNPESIRMVIDSVGEKAFDGCSRLSNLIFSEGLKTIGDYAFNGCASLGAIDIPASVTYIGEGVFDDCSKLSQIRVKTANKRYSSGNGVLYNRDMTTLLVYPNMRGKTYTVPQGVTRIESFAFYNCTNLESVTLPDGLVSIGDGAFDGCTRLVSLTLPASLKSIGMGIVDHCEKTLKELHSKMVQPLSLGEYPEYAFFYYSKQSDICTLYVPKGSKDNYSKAAGWKNFKRIVEEGESMNPEVPERTDSTLTVIWEPVAEATDYVLNIYRDVAKTELIATYTFDANGKLKSTGFSYQLKGLEAGSTYYIETTAVKQINGETVILAQSTTVAETTGSSVDNGDVSVNKPQIRIGNGQIWIQSPLETEVRIYNLSGYCVCAKRISGTSSIRLSSGMYIVLIGEVRYKIVVR